MYKLSNTRLAGLALALLLVTSCGKTNKQGVVVPKNAAAVLHINGETINSKLTWDEISKSDVFKEAMDELNSDTTAPNYIKQLAKDPANSGIDTKKDLQVFIVKQNNLYCLAIAGSVTDVAKFEKFNADITEGGGTSSEKDGVKYLSKFPMCVGWNKDRFLYVANVMDDLNRELVKEDEEGNKKVNTDMDLGAICKALFDLKEDESMAKDEKYSAMMADKADMHLWVNAEYFPTASSMSDGLPFRIDTDKFTKGNIAVISATFENGKIAIKSKSYMNKELAALAKKYKGGDISEDLLKHLPNKDIPAVFALNYKPEGLKEMIKFAGVESIVNLGLAMTGFTMDDFVNANKGDFLLALTSINTVSDTLDFGGSDGKPYIYSKPKPEFIMAASIKDKDAFSKLIKAAQKAGKGSEDDADAPKFSVNDQYFVLGNNKAVANDYLTGGGNTGLIKQIGGQSVGGFANLQVLMKGMKTDKSEDSIFMEQYNLNLKMWDNVLLKGGDFEDGALVMTFDINLMDKTTNSLKQLNSFGAAMAALEKKRRNQYSKFEVIEPVKDSVAPKPSAR